MSMGRLIFIMSLVLVIVVPASDTRGQSNDEVNAAIQFNLTSPGARSLGLGGAFVGLADDATAAYTNPAGLLQISRPEVSVEGRHWTFEHHFAEAGRASGTVTGEGVDTIAGVRQGEATNDVQGLSFLSYVYPRERWAVAAYRHQLSNFEAEFQTQGVFLTDGGSDFRLLPIQTQLDLRLVNFGLSGAYQITPDLGVGVGLSYYDLSLDSRTERFDIDGFFGPPLFDQPPLFAQDQHADEGVVAFIAGVLWKPEGKRWQVGGVYRQGPDLDVELAVVADGVVAITDTAAFDVPDAFAVGIAYEITRNWKVAFDYNRVQYSDLTDSMTNLVGDLDEDNFFLDDGNQYHLGFEYRFPRTPIPVRLRFGGWQEPAHQIQYRGDDPGERVLFAFGDDDEHGTVGIGAVFLDDRLEVNAAADFAERTTTASLSVVWRFLKD